MKNLLVLSTLILGLSGIVYATNEGNGNGNGGPETGGGSVVGPIGPAGPSGKDGLTVNGTNGKDGKDATTAFHGTNLAVDAAVRLYDGKRVQLQAFDTYILGSHRGDDVFGQGFNQTIGARIVLKLGSSYEEREIAKLKKMLGVK